jgi:hypothetical protein
VLERARVPAVEKLSRLFQELAWKAVIPHPISGVPAKATR